MGAISSDVRSLEGVIVPVLAIVLVLAAVLVPLTPAQAQNETVPFETDPIQSAGTDGPVWVSEVVGDQLWLGGAFSNVRNPAVMGQPDIPSQNLAIIDLNTGLVAGRTFEIDGPVWTIAHRDRTVWVGGEFTTVDGQARENLVAFDAMTGEIRPEFSGGSGPFIWDLEESDGWLYAGTDAGATRFDPVTGERDQSFSPGPRSGVRAIDIHDDLLAIGHWEGKVSGVWRISTDNELFAMRNTAYDIEFSPDGASVFVADKNNSFYRYRVNDGQLVWEEGETAGDAQALAVTDDGIVFGGFHENWDGNRSRKAVALSTSNGRELDWYVEMDSYWGVFDIEVTPQGAIFTGQFENTNGLETRRVAIFRPTEQWEAAQAVVPLGDADASGDVDLRDLQAILNHLTGKTDDGFNSLGADADEDGQINLFDALLIARMTR